MAAAKGKLSKTSIAILQSLFDGVCGSENIKKFALIDLLVSLRASFKSESIFSALLYAKPKLPMAPAFDTAATNSGVVVPPAIGA